MVLSLTSLFFFLHLYLHVSCGRRMFTVFLPNSRWLLITPFSKNYKSTNLSTQSTAALHLLTQKRLGVTLITRLFCLQRMMMNAKQCVMCFKNPDVSECTRKTIYHAMRECRGEIHL